MAQMDIRIVLGQLYPGLYTGPMSGTGKTYKEFAPHWPAENGPVPTEAKMKAEWKKIEAVEAAKKDDAEIEADIDALLAGVADTNTRKILKALMFETFMRDEGALKRHGVNIER